MGITESVNQSIDQSITFKSPSLVPAVIYIFLVYLFLQPSGRIRCFQFLLEVPKGQIQVYEIINGFYKGTYILFV